MLNFGLVAAQSTVPGDSLYPVKRFVEQVHVATALGAAAKVDVDLQLAQARLTETRVLLQRGETKSAQEVLEEYRNQIHSAEATVVGFAQDNPGEGQALSLRAQDTAEENLTLLEEIGVHSPKE